VLGDRGALTRFAWLSVAAAVATIGLKAAAYWVTGSVGLMSDALESVVNLVAALLALAMLTVAARPADEGHAYGHFKAEYFASAVEGALIVLAAVAIAAASADRLLHPRAVEEIGLGLGISAAAALVNLAVARVLLAAGRRHRSIALEADAQHLMTDVWTSVGVVVGVAGVALTDWEWLDPVIALLVAANIVWTGVLLVRRSAQGLLDGALPTEERAAVQAILDGYAAEGAAHHALRTRQAGAHRFVSFHVLVPGSWSVARGHALLERMERDVRRALPSVTVFTHLEPAEDPTAWADTALERAGATARPARSSAPRARSDQPP
jgi:cation diffusion facilitator family transporter